MNSSPTFETDPKGGYFLSKGHEKAQLDHQLGFLFEIYFT
jgi:hypothetical protein